MPRIVSNAIRAKLFERLGTSPKIRFLIYWDQLDTYSTFEEEILEISPITVTRRDDSMGSVGTCSLRLDDSIGLLKDMMNRFQVENARCRVVLYYDDIPNDAVTLIEGRANNLSWDEGDRILNLTVESEVFSGEIGYAPTTDDIPGLNPDAVEVPWPVCFGSPIHVPAIHIKHCAEGTLQSRIWLGSDIYTTAETVHRHTIKSLVPANVAIAQILAGTADVTQPYQQANFLNSTNVYSYVFDEDDTVLETGIPTTNVIYVRNGELFPQGTEVVIIIKNIRFRGIFNGNEFTVTEANAPYYTNVQFAARPGGNPDSANPCYAWLSDSTGIHLVGKHIFVSIPGNGEMYNICTAQDGNRITLAIPFCTPNGDPYPVTDTSTLTRVYPIDPTGVIGDIRTPYIKAVQTAWATSTVSKVQYSRYLLELEKAKKDSIFWRAPEETQVYLDSYDPELYVCNSIPSTNIRAVYAYRDIGHGRRLFSPIPKDYYVKHLSYNINGFAATVLEFPQLLSTMGEGWDDQIYVTLTSSVGPNPADIIYWILANYTNCTFSLPDFALVKGWVAGYPMNFAVTNKENALRLAQRIAWEARCALSVVSGTAILYYLPIIPQTVFTLNEGNIVLKSLSFSYGDMADITTRLRFEWKDSYKPRPQNVYLDSKKRARFDSHHVAIGTQNISLYGVVNRSEEIVAYNYEPFVRKTGDFWLNRFSNSWTRVRCSTFIQGVLALPFDGVYINLSNSDSEIQYATFAMIESASYDPKTKLTSLEILLPIKQGCTEVDPYFWPFVDVVPAYYNPAAKYKEIGYDYHGGMGGYGDPGMYDSVIGGLDSSLNNQPSTVAVVTSVDAPTENSNNTNLPVGNDTVTATIYNGSQSQATDALVVTNENPTGHSWPGQRVEVKPNPNGTYDQVGVIDDYVCAITGTLSLGNYIGTMYSMGEIFKQGSKYVTGALTVTPNLPNGQGTPVIIQNLGEEGSRAWTYPVINTFPWYLPCKLVDKFANGMQVVLINFEAKVIRNIRYNTTTDKMQGSYRVNPTVDGDWFDMITFVSCS